MENTLAASRKAAAFGRFSAQSGSAIASTSHTDGSGTMKPLSARALKVKESSTLAITAKAKELAAAGEGLIAFTAGEPDYDTPEHIKEAAMQAARDGFTKYTATPGIIELRRAICKKLKDDNGLSYEPSQIIVSNGAKHSLSNIFCALLNEGDEVIMPAPYWLTYPELVALSGGVSRYVHGDSGNGYKPTAAAIREAVTPKTKAILINSPNNPSGAVYGRDELSAVAAIAAENDLYIISDEIYEKLIYDDAKPHVSIASLGPDAFARTIVVNGYSKSYSMTGWRVGYTASGKEIAAVMANIQSHQTSNINTLTQKAAIAAQEGDQDCIESMRLSFKKRKELMCGLVSRIEGVKAARPDGAFYLFADVSALFGKKASKGREIASAADFAEFLLDEQKLAIVPCADFGYPNHVRLSYACSEESINEGVRRLGEFVKGLA